MEEIVGNEYRFRLNKDAGNYQEILSDIRNELKKNQKIHESQKSGLWDSHVHIDHNDIIHVIIGGDYSTAPVSLSTDLFKKIRENIKTEPHQYYAYSMDRGENLGAIKNCEGLAKELAEKVLDANMKLTNKDGQETFKYYIHNPSEIEQLTRYGEPTRLKRKLLNNAYQVDFDSAFLNDKKEFNELWTAYLLVNGTKELFPIKTELGFFPISLKEIFYAEDHKKHKRGLGKKILQHLMMVGVKFNETTKDISGNLMIDGNMFATKKYEDPEIINQWFKKNKARFICHPKLPEDVVETLKNEFPATYEKLNKIIELTTVHKHKPRM
jgi:uncharacterized protein (DUF2461 family)